MLSWIAAALAQSGKPPPPLPTQIVIADPGGNRYKAFQSVMTYCTGVQFDIVEVSQVPFLPGQPATPDGPIELEVGRDRMEFLGDAVRTVRPNAAWGHLMASGGQVSGLHISDWIVGAPGPAATGGRPQWGWDHDCYVNVPHGEFNLDELALTEEGCRGWLSVTGMKEYVGYWVGAPARVRIERAFDNVTGFNYHSHYVTCMDVGKADFPMHCSVFVRTRQSLIEEGRALVLESMASLQQMQNPCQDLAPQP